MAPIGEEDERIRQTLATKVARLQAVKRKAEEAVASSQALADAARLEAVTGRVRHAERELSAFMDAAAASAAADLTAYARAEEARRALLRRQPRTLSEGFSGAASSSAAFFHAELLASRPSLFSSSASSSASSSVTPAPSPAPSPTRLARREAPTVSQARGEVAGPTRPHLPGPGPRTAEVMSAGGEALAAFRGGVAALAGPAACATLSAGWRRAALGSVRSLRLHADAPLQVVLSAPLGRPALHHLDLLGCRAVCSDDVIVDLMKGLRAGGLRLEGLRLAGVVGLGRRSRQALYRGGLVGWAFPASAMEPGCSEKGEVLQRGVGTLRCV